MSSPQKYRSRNRSVLLARLQDRFATAFSSDRDRFLVLIEGEFARYGE
jgi:hypothetical protein